MIRWYIVQDKVILRQIEAPDKQAADALAHTMGLGVGVVSVLEYEEIQREIRELQAERVRNERVVEAVIKMDNNVKQETDRGVHKTHQQDVFADQDRTTHYATLTMCCVRYGEYYLNRCWELGLDPKTGHPLPNPPQVFVDDFDGDESADRYGEGRVA